MKDNDHQYEFFVRFILICGSFLIIALSLSRIYFPRQFSSLYEQLFQAGNISEQDQGFFRRLFSSGRSLLPPSSSNNSLGISSEILLKEWLDRKEIGRKKEATSSLPLTPNHKILRENVITHLILHDRFNLDQETAWSSLQNVGGQGDYRAYELKRFLCEILWKQYQEDQKNPQILKKLAKITLDLIQSPYAYFEDFYNAGLACLLGNDPEKAFVYFQKAQDSWPAKGQAASNVFFSLLLTQAARGKERETLEMLENFQTSYPDWIYGETFIPDIEDIEAIYPRAPLLNILHGRVVQYIHDYATALQFFQRALASTSVTLETRSIVTKWIEGIQQECL